MPQNGYCYFFITVKTNKKPVGYGHAKPSWIRKVDEQVWTCYLIVSRNLPSSFHVPGIRYTPVLSHLILTPNL